MKPPLTDEQRSRLHTLVKNHQHLTERRARLRAGLRAVLTERMERIDILRDRGRDKEVEKRSEVELEENARALHGELAALRKDEAGL